MKGRFIEMLGGKGSQIHNFDRQKLVEGYTQDGKYVPAGGVVLHNGTLAGYIQAGGEYSKPTWRIIGTINRKDSNYRYIPKYQSCNAKHKGEQDKFNTARYEKKRSITRRRHKNLKGGGPPSKNEKPVSLKTAVKMLRDYYRHNFN